VDAPTIMHMTSESSRRMLTWMLQHIHVVKDDDGGTFIAKDIREPLGAVLNQIVSILTREAAGTDTAYRLLATQILRDVCFFVTPLVYFLEMERIGGSHRQGDDAPR
jgi:hypothetical protein